MTIIDDFYVQMTILVLIVIVVVFLFDIIVDPFKLGDQDISDKVTEKPF